MAVQNTFNEYYSFSFKLLSLYLTNMPCVKKKKKKKKKTKKEENN